MECIIFIIIVLVFYSLGSDKKENKTNNIDIKPSDSSKLNTTSLSKPKPLETPSPNPNPISIPISNSIPTTITTTISQPALCLQQSDKDNIKVLPEYKKVLSNLLSAEQTITFVTGGAGTGKSYLIKWLRTQIVSDKTVFLAPTGVAARNIHGLTIHSFCRFKPTLVDFEKGYKTDLDYITDSHLSGDAKRVEYIIIDEISMVRCDLLDGIDEFLRFFTKSIKPFGGKNVLFVGDLFQLPPIVRTKKYLKDKKSDADYLREMGYLFPFFCFNSHVWKNLQIDLITLNQPQRQNNKEFYNILTSLRFGQNIQDCIDYFNRNCFCKSNLNLPYPFLTIHRDTALQVNNKKLRELETKSYFSTGEFFGDYPKDMDDLPAPKELEIKVGARVMTVKNSPDKSYVNGSMGYIENIIYDSKISSFIIDVLLDNGNIVCVKKEVWGKYEYHFNDEKQEYELILTGSYSQIPLTLAWALTIHKAQGLTLSKMTFYKKESRPFASGHSYVALSRCHSVKDVSLDTELTQEDINVKKDYKKIIFEEYLRLKSSNN